MQLLKRSYSIKTINTLFFLVFTILCFYYGKERTLMFDGSRGVFMIFNNKYPFIDENRFPTLVNCILPLLVSKIGLTFNFVINTYIVSYCVLPISLFIFFRFIVKNEKQLTVFLLSLSFLYFHSFFVASHDTVTVYYYVFYIYFFLTNIFFHSKVNNYLVVLFFIMLIVFGHFTQMITMTALVGYLLISKRLKTNIFFILGSTLVLFILKIVFFKGESESNILITFTSMHNSFQYMNIVLVDFLKSLFFYNINYFIFLIITLIFLLNNKEYTIFMYLLTTSICVTLFVCYLLRESQSFSFYIEPNLKCLSVLLSVIITDYLIINTDNVKSKIMLIVIYSCSIIGILYGGSDIKEYFKYISNNSKNLKENTIFVTKKNILNILYIFTPLESAMINKYEHNNGHFMAFTTDNKLLDIGFIPEQAKDKKSEFYFNDKIVYVKAPDNMKEKLNLRFPNSYFGYYQP